MSVSHAASVRTTSRQGQQALWVASEGSAENAETFARRNGIIERRVSLRSGGFATSQIGASAGVNAPIGSAEAESLFLRLEHRPPVSGRRGSIRAVDLFAGCGGLSLGVAEAGRALELDVGFVAVDTDHVAAQVFQDNFEGSEYVLDDVAKIFDGESGTPATLQERQFKRRAPSVNILVGGPPCQGHSGFNNRTRHSDARNSLYVRMVRAAEVLEPSRVILENVPGALSDRAQVVQQSARELERLGYSTSLAVVDALAYGVPQRRKRLLLLASSTSAPGPRLVAATGLAGAGVRDVAWAIADLEDRHSADLLDQTAASADATRARIDYLFENELFELPNAERPACHSKGGHSYRSIYGRLRWDEPAQTVTTGFYSMCMGRYVHPSRRRTLTAREAARLQSFPDFFRFSSVEKRGELARLIGNAVPMKIPYSIILEALR